MECILNAVEPKIIDRKIHRSQPLTGRRTSPFTITVPLKPKLLFHSPDGPNECPTTSTPSSASRGISRSSMSFTSLTSLGSSNHFERNASSPAVLSSPRGGGSSNNQRATTPTSNGSHSGTPRLSSFRFPAPSSSSSYLFFPTKEEAKSPSGFDPSAPTIASARSRPFANGVDPPHPQRPQTTRVGGVPPRRANSLGPYDALLSNNGASARAISGKVAKTDLDLSHPRIAPEKHPPPQARVPFGELTQRQPILTPRKSSEIAEDRFGECNICMEVNIDSMFVPCGHFVSCYECGKGLKECPVCRTPTEGCARIS